MPAFAANLCTLFTERPLPARIAAAAEAGFDGVEIPYPYDSPAIEIRNAQGQAQVPVVLMAAPPPNYTGGTPGFAAQPGGEERFRHDFRRALRYAQALKARHLHILSGPASGAAGFDTLVANLSWAAATAPRQSLLIEPMNAGDLPGYFLTDFALAARVINTVGAPNLGLLFDSYHAQRITGDLGATWAQVAPLVRHVHLAATPDQGEPDKGGQIDFAAFYRQLATTGYDGWIGADYRPRTATLDGLSWLQAARAATAPLPRPA